MNNTEPHPLESQLSFDESDDLGGHPLFPRMPSELGPDRRKFDLIQIVRFLPDKTREVCPRLWKGSELRSWEQVVEAYGGECQYQLQAQDAKTRRYTAKSERVYFGSPARKPFVQSGETATKRKTAPAGEPVHAPATPPHRMAPSPHHHHPPPEPTPPPLPQPAPAPSMNAEVMALMQSVLESQANFQAILMRALLEPQAPPPPPPMVQPVNDSIAIARDLVQLLRGTDSGRANGEMVHALGEFLDEDDADDGDCDGSTENDLAQLGKLLATVRAESEAATAQKTAQPVPQQSAPAPAPVGFPMENAPWSAMPPIAWKGWEIVRTPMGLLLRRRVDANSQPALVAPPPSSVDSAQAPIATPVAPPQETTAPVAESSHVAAPPATHPLTMAAEAVQACPTQAATLTQSAPPSTPGIGNAPPNANAHVRRFRTSAAYLTAAGFIPRYPEDPLEKNRSLLPQLVT